MRCPHCGVEVGVGRSRCPSCGASVLDDSLGGLEDILSAGAPVRRGAHPASAGQGPNAAWSPNPSPSPTSLGVVGQGPNAAWSPNAYAWDARGAGAYGRPGNRNSSSAIAIVCVVMFVACVLIGRAYATVRAGDVGGEGLSAQYGEAGVGASDADRSGQGADSAANVPPAGGSPKAEDGTGGTDAGAADAPGQSTDDDGISPNWRDREFSIDGQKFTLGSFTVGEFMDRTGWTIDESASAIVDSQISLGQGQMPIYLHHPSYGDRGDVLLMMGTTNQTSTTSDVQDGTVTSLLIYVAPHHDVRFPDFEIAGGIRLRGTSPDQAKSAIAARPVQDSTTTTPYEDHTYTQRTIGWYGGNAEYGLILAFDGDGDELDGIGMIVRAR